MRLNELRQIDVSDPVSLLDHIYTGHDEFGIIVCDLFQRPVFTLFRFPAVHDRHGHLHISIRIKLDTTGANIYGLLAVSSTLGLAWVSRKREAA